MFKLQTTEIQNGFTRDSHFSAFICRRLWM